MIVRRISLAIFFLFSILPGLCAYGDISSANDSLDITLANKTLNTLSQQNIAKKASVLQLKRAIASLEKFETQAKKCVENNSKELEELNKKMASIPSPLVQINSLQGNKAPLTAEEEYLSAKKEELNNQLSECRLFLLRSDEVTADLNTKLRAILKNRLLYKEPDVLSNLLTFPVELKNFYDAFDASLFIQTIGLSSLSTTQCAILLLLLFLGVILSIKLKSILNHFISPNKETRFSLQVTQATLSVLRKYLLFLVTAILFALFVHVINFSSTEFAHLTFIADAVLVYVVYLSLIRFFFYPPPPASGFTHLPEHLAKVLTRRLKLLGGLTLTGSLVFILFRTQLVPEALSSLTKSLFITLITINLIAVIWLVKQLPKMLYHFHFLRFLITVFLCLALGVILIAEWVGYHMLALYLLHGIVITVLAAFLARLFHKVITAILDSFNGKGQNWQQKFRRHLGLKGNERFWEVLWLGMLFYFLIWTGFVFFLLEIWGVAQTNLQRILEGFVQGFQISQFTIVPSRIIVGLIFFILLVMITRLLRTYIAKTAKIELTVGNREALASIAGYIGFAIALLIGLLIAGVNFSGLAIIAGALSVGIGFGLQGVVNNFVSGIILLIERPIKPGDRVIVGDTEGFVHRISIRSTHIITTHRTDVIVPNSDLISKPVTNFMLYDTNFLISTYVGIGYGSDITLAKDIMLEIATKHREVISDRKGFEPKVYFRKFGDNSLEFELVCLIRDVNLKSDVQSDLNFMIEKTFREHNIEIAFPQREITIRNWPK